MDDKKMRSERGQILKMTDDFHVFLPQTFFFSRKKSLKFGMESIDRFVVDLEVKQLFQRDEGSSSSTSQGFFEHSRENRISSDRQLL